MNYDRDSCTLSRLFGEGSDKVIAQLIRYEPGGPGLDLRFIGSPVRGLNNRSYVQLRFGNSGEFVRTNAMTGFTGSGRSQLPALFLNGRLDNLDTSKLDYTDILKMTQAERNTLSAIDPAIEVAVTSVWIKVSGRTVVLELGSMGAAMREMRKCTLDLLTAWGLPHDLPERLAVPPQPKGNPGNWLVSTDYPRDSLEGGQQAIIRYRLMVDAEGRVTDCAVQSAIAKGDFAKISCDLLKRRARYDPARAADGTAIPAYSVGKILWLIP